MTGFEAIREVYNLTLEDIASMLGIKKQSVSEWGKGGKPIPQKRVKELADKLGISEEYFTTTEIDEIKKLEIQSEKLFHSVQGKIVIESIEEGEGENDILITPKDFDTDPRFSKIYQNHMHIRLIKNLELLNENFIDIESMTYETEQERTETLKFYCKIVETFIDAICFTDNHDELLSAIKKFTNNSEQHP